jgi:uncharacterized Zn finger protein (UPF0148 family)
MTQKEIVSKIIFDSLGYIYCPNCRYNNERDNCDDCHRKAMGWEISKEFSEEMADEILLNLNLIEVTK